MPLASTILTDATDVAMTEVDLPVEATFSRSPVRCEGQREGQGRADPVIE
jgi:hypothetical protein